MDGFEEKLNSILSSPEDMKKIMELAQTLSGGKTQDTPKDEKRASSFSDAPELDPRLLKLLSRVMRGFNGEDDKSRLLCSIKPYLSEDRREKVDRAMKIARAARIAKSALGEMDGGDPDLF